MKSNGVLQSKVRFQYEFVLFLKQVFIRNIRDKVDTPNKQNWECFSQRATSEKWNVLLLLSCWSHVTAALDSQTSGLFSCSLLMFSASVFVSSLSSRTTCGFISCFECHTHFLVLGSYLPLIQSNELYYVKYNTKRLPSHSIPLPGKSYDLFITQNIIPSSSDQVLGWTVNQ